MSKSVQSNSAILVHFTLKLDDGSTAESTRNNGKPALFRLGDTSLSEGLEQQLLGLKEGRKGILAGARCCVWHTKPGSYPVFFPPRIYRCGRAGNRRDYALYRNGWQRNARRDS